MELRGSKTEANLLAAFSGESQARNKYTFLPLPHARKATSRLAPFLTRRQPTKRSMQKYGLNTCRAAPCRTLCKA